MMICRWPASGTDMQEGNAGLRRAEFGSTADCSTTTPADPSYDPTNFYSNPFSIIPYDYADIDDYKFIQTPTSPTPSSTPGPNARKTGRFNPHLAHLAGFNFRKESCGSCHSKMKQSRENLHKDVRYFCKNCRMLHRYEDAIGRSCNSLAFDPAGSISSCLDKKAFYYTPTHIHLAIISANSKKRDGREMHKSPSTFSQGSLQNTKSESNLARSQYSSKSNISGLSNDIFSPNPRRKISDICTHSMDADREFERPHKTRSSVSTIYSPNLAQRISFGSETSQPSCSYDPQYSSQFDLQSQCSIDYPSTSCLQSCRERSEIEKRLMPLRSDSQFDLPRSDYVQSKLRMPPKSHRRTLAQERIWNPPHRGSPRCSRQPLSPRVVENLNQSTTAMDCMSLRSNTFSYDMSAGEGSSLSNSLASSISSLQQSPCHSLSRPSSSRCPSLYHLADGHSGYSTTRSTCRSSEDRRAMAHQVRTRSSDTGDMTPGSSRHDIRSLGAHHDPSSWYSMTSVNTTTDDDYCYEDEEEEEEDDDDDEDQITVAECRKKTTDQVQSGPQVIVESPDSETVAGDDEQCSK